ncbi:MAG: hypothetical protein AAGE52_31425 [Myxococcota bacterium]
MATVLIGLAALCLVFLLVLDLVVMRGADRFDGSRPNEGDRVWKKTPPPVIGGAWISTLLGVAAFPGTLAPVVITVLAFQAHPVLSDGWISLTAVIVAGLSMSAAVKCLRVSHFLRNLTREMRGLLTKTLIYLAVWAIFVVVGCALMRPADGNLALIVWAYVGFNTVGIVAAAIAIRSALDATAPPTGHATHSEF